MAKCEYTKPPKTYQEQIELLKSRGLIIDDEKRAVRHLSAISYYRLSAYMLPYKQWANDVCTDNFKLETTWSQVHDLYVFDRKLRILIFDAIERLEIAIRTQIIYQLSHKYGSHWQDNKDIFKVHTRTRKDGAEVTIDVFKDIQKHIKEQLVSNKAEVFIQHYAQKYDKPTNPPSWMSVEIMYFNHLSQICNNLNERSDIAAIAKWFGLPPEIFCSWLHSVNYVRNICAHHARLWNRDMNIVPMKLGFSKTKVWISNPDTVQRSKMYYFVCMINYLLQTANPSSSFKARLIALLDEYKHVVNTGYMGFPENWKEENIWK
ncbi:MAG TPA: Abi family protein [Paludibacteraceae bacterium]|nr:Abi family protein [Paludibacteraceae bacterium]